MSSRRPTVRVFGIALALVLAGVAGPITGGVAGNANPVNAGSEQGTAFQQATPSSNNSSIQHKDPDEVSENGNLAAIRSHLRQQLANRLAKSSVLLSQGEYEKANSLLEGSYSETLEKYVDVAGDTDGEGSTSSFEEAKREQQEYSETVSTYQQTLEEYREARENGNKTRARRLARKLNELAEETNQTQQNLTETYNDIENTTAVNLSEATQSTESVQENISEQQSEINDVTFVETNLTVSVDADSASFTDPVTLTGRISTENGSAIANQTVTIAVGTRSYTVFTDGNGRFQLTYRPTGIAANSSNVKVEYVPNSTAIYLGSETVLDLHISQTTATIELTELTRSAAYNDEVVVVGVVSVNGTPVPNIPVVVTVAGTPLSTVNTSANGTFHLRTSLPVDVRAGRQQLTITDGAEISAVSVEPTTRSIEIRETQTSLLINETERNDRYLTITGRLTTTGGTPIANQSVEVRINGTLVETIQTRPDGTFRVTVEPNSALTTALVVLEFTGAGSNLAPARTEARVSLQTDRLNRVLGNLSRVEIAAGSGFVLLIAGAGLLLWRRRGERDIADTEPVATAGSDETHRTAAAEGFLAAARDRISDGRPGAAVQRAYAGVRAIFEPETDAQTHWEFFNTADVSADRRSDLRDLTEIFEESTFGPSDPDEATAEAAVETAEVLIGEEGEA